MRRENVVDADKRALIRRLINTVRQAKGMPLLAPPSAKPALKKSEAIT